MKTVDPQILQTAKDRLLNGDVVAIPTETVYGLAASIYSEKGLRKIFQIKERPFFDPLIVHVASIKDAMSLTKDWPPLADYLARVFWPGPLTLVLPKNDKVNPLITSGLETVAIRYPAHPLTQNLIKAANTPLAAPSANKFGKTSPSCAQHVRDEFPSEDLLIIDGGPCEVGVESTVITFGESESGNAEILILRPGGVTEEALQKALKKWSHPVSISRQTSEASPGHLKHHYMPDVPLVIVSESELKILPKSLLENIQNRLPKEKRRELKYAEELQLSQNADLAARELYGEMRRLSEMGVDLIFVRRSAERAGGLWQAIWDRLEKAASLDISDE